MFRDLDQQPRPDLNELEIVTRTNTFIDALHTANSQNRDSLYRKAFVDLFPHPNQYLSVISHLQTNTDKPYVDVALKRLTDPRAILKGYNEMETLDSWLHLNQFFDQLNGPFDQQTRAYILNMCRLPEGELAQMRPPQITTALRKASDISYLYAGTLIFRLYNTFHSPEELADYDTKTKEALRLWLEEVSQEDPDKIDTYDLFALSLTYSELTTRPGQTDAAFLGFRVVENILGFTDSNLSQSTFNKKQAQLQKALKLPPKQIPLPYTEPFSRLITSAEKILTQPKHCLNHAIHPQGEPLVDTATLIYCAGMHNYFNQIGKTSYLLPVAGSNFLLTAWSTEPDPQVTTVHIQTKLKEILKLPTHPDQDDISPTELTTLLTYLAPKVDVPAISEHINSLKTQITGGLYTLSSRGDRIRFDSPDETRIRDMGLSQISFHQHQDRIEVRLDWGNYQTTFDLDQDLNLTTEFPHLEPDKALWLQAFVLSYLRAIKNPPQDLIEEANGNGGKHKNTTSAQFLGRRAHLRVLPINNTPTQTEEVENQMRLHFGITLQELNDHFLAVQNNLSSQRQISGKFRPLIASAIARAKTKDHLSIQWVTDSTGEKVMKVIDNNSGQPVDGRFMISYVSEGHPDDDNFFPKSYLCPGIASTLTKFEISR